MPREQSTLVDLADVGDEVGLDAARLADELVESPEQLVVGDVVQSESGLRVAVGRGPGVERDGGLGFMNSI